MPFAPGARITATSECSEAEVLFYYYVDYEELDALARRARALPRAVAPRGPDRRRRATQASRTRSTSSAATNTDRRRQLHDPRGRGPRPLRRLPPRHPQPARGPPEWNWYGEGDDMIFIDGEPFPPSLHGTGTEDYFNTAWCPTQEYSAPYHGITLPGGPNWSGKISLYRFHVEDPVRFREVDPGDHRARPRQPAHRRRVQHRLLVPGRAARAVRRCCPSSGDCRDRTGPARKASRARFASHPATTVEALEAADAAGSAEA